jgi:flagellar biosynthesis protein FliQ
MVPTAVIDAGREAIFVCIQIAGPLLITALVVALLISLVQAITQIQDQTLTFVPKLAAVAFMGLLLMPWMLRVLASYTAAVLQSIAHIGP